MVCDKCGTENASNRKPSQGLCDVVFATSLSQRRLPLAKNYSVVIASSCKNCGNIYSMRLLTPLA